MLQTSAPPPTSVSRVPLSSLLWGLLRKERLGGGPQQQNVCWTWTDVLALMLLCCGQPWR